MQEGDWARKVAVGCSAGGRKSNRKNERVRTKCPPSPAHSFIAQQRPTPCRCANEREREREREREIERERERERIERERERERAEGPAQSTHSMRREGEREGSGGRTEGLAQSAAILMVRL